MFVPLWLLLIALLVLVFVIDHLLARIADMRETRRTQAARDKETELAHSTAPTEAREARHTAPPAKPKGKKRASVRRP